MSTSAIIKITDGCETMNFYRHWDGNPEVVLPQLNLLLDRVKDETLRDNTQQFSGHLIVLGAIEYNSIPNDSIYKDWKVGAYEPVGDNYPDVSCQYVIDLKKKTVTVSDS